MRQPFCQHTHHQLARPDPGKIIARWPGHMARLDVKKVGRIPDGGGWRIHGRYSAQKRAVDPQNRRRQRPALRPALHRGRVLPTGLHRILDDEPGTPAAAFLARARVWFAAQNITRMHRSVTDNGACYRSADFARNRRHPHPAPEDTAVHRPPQRKVERYQRILAEELLYAREYGGEDDRSAAVTVWNIHYNYHRPHSAAGGRPPASKLQTGVTNVLPRNS